jgi:hypothetical protein
MGGAHGGPEASSAQRIRAIALGVSISQVMVGIAAGIAAALTAFLARFIILVNLARTSVLFWRRELWNE